MDDDAQFQLDLEAYRAVAANDAPRLRSALAAGGRPSSRLGPHSFLSLAAINGSRECVELLLAMPDPRLGREDDGPAWWARHMRHSEVADLIESYFDAERQRRSLLDSIPSASASEATVRGL